MKTLAVALTLGLSGWALLAAEPDITKLPKPSEKKAIDYAKEIKPLFEASCIKCHGPEKPKGKYRLDSRDAMIKGGESEKPAVVVGKSDQSPLIHYVADLVEDMEMPPKDKREKYPGLKPEQIALLRAWIDQGAKWE